MQASRSTWILGAVAAAGVVSSVVLWRQKRALEDELAARGAAAADPWRGGATAGGDAPAAAAGGGDDPAAGPGPRAPIFVPRPLVAGTAPALEPEHQESRLERRARRQKELTALIGRLDGESADDYRARVVPLITAGLARPRTDVEDQRKQLEAKAGVTPEQHQKLDAAFGEVYDDVLKYTNGAIADGQLTPYKSNVAGMLEYAGGLGAILETADGRIGQILTPDQQRTFADSGFEWGEYLGVLAPWEKLDPPPPPH